MLLEIFVVLLTAVLVYHWSAYPRDTTIYTPFAFPLLNHFYIFRKTKKHHSVFDALIRKAKAVPHNPRRVVQLLFPFSYRKVIVVADRSIVLQILKDPHNFKGRDEFDPIVKIAPLGMAGLLDGEQHTNHKGMLANSLSTEKNLSEYTNSINEKTELTLKLLGDKQGQVVDIARMCKLLTADIAAKIVFAADSDCQVNPNAKLVKFDALKMVLTAVTAGHLPDFLSGFFNPTIRAEKKILTDLMDDLFARRSRDTSTADGTVFGVLLKALESDSKRWSLEEFYDEAFSMFAGGLETVSYSLAWSFYLLSLPENNFVWAPLLKEINEVLGDRDEIVYEDLKNLKFATSIILESLRFLPPGIFFFRHVAETTTVDGVTFPRDSRLIVSMYSMNRDETYYRDPMKFVPQRWEEFIANTEFRHIADRFDTLVFGGGHRVCPGKKIAMVEDVLIFCRIARKFRFQIEPGFVVDDVHGITLQPTSVMVKVCPN